MKRINTIFTALNVLVAAVMLIQIGICYFSEGYVSALPSVSFIYAVLYIPPLVLINVIWKVIRKKKEVRVQSAEMPVSNSLARDTAWLKRVNIICIMLDVLLVATMLIHNAIDICETSPNLSFFNNLVGSTWVYYTVPFVLINDAWVVVYMNMKERLYEMG